MIFEDWREKVRWWRCGYERKSRATRAEQCSDGSVATALTAAYHTVTIGNQTYHSEDPSRDELELPPAAADANVGAIMLKRYRTAAVSLSEKCSRDGDVV